MAAGARLDELRTTFKELLDLGASPLTLLPPFRRRLGPLTPWARFVDVRDHADALIRALIDERRRSGEEGDDVLTMLLAARDEDGEPMTDRELRDELVTLLVAGHETTASALSWGFEQLLRAPEVLERVTRAALEDDTAYLEATVKEILRRRPVLPIAGPRRIKQPIEIGGRSYPAGPGLRRLHLPRPPRREHLPGALRVPPRALPRRQPRQVQLDPVRRRRAPLPRRLVRAARDADRTARHPRRGRGQPPRSTAARAPAAARSR